MRRISAIVAAVAAFAAAVLCLCNGDTYRPIGWTIVCVCNVMVLFRKNPDVYPR